jgi:hypothetical protein
MTCSTAAKSGWVREDVSTLAKVLMEADEQLTRGTDLDRLRHARQNLNAVAPGCLLVRMLDCQIAARVKARRVRDAEAASLHFMPIHNICQHLQLEQP